MSLIKALRQFRRYKGRIKFYSKDGMLMYEYTLERTLYSIFYDNFWNTFVLEYNIEYGWIKLDCNKVGGGKIMILWNELEKLFEESINREQSLEIQLVFNGHKITSFLGYNNFIYTISLDMLELESTKYDIVDKTIENEQVKSPIRYIQVYIKL